MNTPIDLAKGGGGCERQLTTLRSCVAKETSTTSSDIASAASYRETQRWLDRSIERCQCPATTRFLEMVNSRIDVHLRNLEGQDVEGATRLQHCEN